MSVAADTSPVNSELSRQEGKDTTVAIGLRQADASSLLPAWLSSSHLEIVLIEQKQLASVILESGNIKK